MVLPASDAWHPAMIEAMRRDLDVVRITGREQIHDLRGHAPDADLFVADVLGYLATRNLDLTCALTTSSSSVVRQLHADQPDRKFCALVTSELTTQEAPGFDLMVLKTAELGHVVGAAAAAASSEAVGYVLAPHDLERGRFRDGLVAGASLGTVVTTDAEADGVEAVNALLSAGADVVVIGGGPWAQAAADVAVAAGAKIIVPDDIRRLVDEQAIVATWRIQWHRVLRGPVDRLLGRDVPAPLIQGMAQGPFVVRVGPAASAVVNAEINRAIRELGDGRRQATELRSPVEDQDPTDGT